MTIKLSADDYRRLVELAYLGEWMINAQHNPDFHDTAATQVLQQLLAAHPELKHVEQDPETGDYFMTDDWTDALYEKHVLDYDDHVFWDELVDRLAARDVSRQLGIDAEDLERDDYLEQLLPLEDRYRQEIEARGLDRLEVKPDYEP
ncbi:hypothetical protein IPG36_08140 [bacterium]|nr:MAG: hypothetical protein IPG36_08140 [bacterium]